MKRFLHRYGLLLGLALVVIGLDQVSKILVRQFIPLNGTWVPWDWLAPYARLYHVQNSGVAFGMFQGTGWIFAILATAVSALIIWYYPRVPAQDWVVRIALGLQLGGAIGNLIDRLLFQWQVTDFISVGTFAIFNIADSGVTVGVAVLLLGVWLQERREKAAQAAETPAAEAEGQDPSAASASSEVQE